MIIVLLYYEIRHAFCIFVRQDLKIMCMPKKSTFKAFVLVHRGLDKPYLNFGKQRSSLALKPVAAEAEFLFMFQADMQ
jgi:hypothetical protein